MEAQEDLDLEGKLEPEEKLLLDAQMNAFSPNDGKYANTAAALAPYLSPRAEWYTCALVQKVLLETRVEFGLANQENLDELLKARHRISPINMNLLESQITKHDQLAVLEEIGRFVSKETKALLHPGTTSYDILDTARSYLFKGAWKEGLRPVVSQTINQLCELAETYKDTLQVGRTHLQNTSPVPLGSTLAGYAARLANRVEKADIAFDSLKGKISGIVGTGASVEQVVGKGKALAFEKAVLAKLGLEPDYTATQIVQKENLADAGHSVVTLMHVLGDFANDMRILYSSAINEVTSRDAAKRLGGSSADATKNNPINYENIAGKPVIVESGMRALYSLIQTDLHRDLRGSVVARYEPQGMIVETHEAFGRANNALKQLSVNEDTLRANLQLVRDNPSEAMVAILRGAKWTHSKYGVGHDFVKEMGKKAKAESQPIMHFAMGDSEFSTLYHTLPSYQQQILRGELELYLGPSKEKAKHNIEYAREVAGRK